VSLAQASLVWGRIALLSFGGPAGQIAVMHRILVEEKRWLGERRFLHALNYCMLLPGPEAQQLAVYIGWLMNGVAGGLVAGVLFVLPGYLAIMGLSILYAFYGHVGPVAALFFGLKAAVLVVVVQAVARLGRRALGGPFAVVIAAVAFLAIYAFAAPFPLIVLGAAAAGAAGRAFDGAAGTAPADGEAADTLLGDGTPAHARPGWRWSVGVCGVAAVLWLVPVAGIGLGFGWDHVFARIGLFFSQMAMVTFGGAYAALAYVAQAAVDAYGWLRPGEMLDGLGLAETTPGPLIMVVQFVGFLAAFRADTGLPPLVAGVLGGTLATWTTFAPCFLWIFLGAPYVERLREAQVLNAALRAVTAAVVGVILNLALWFGVHVLFAEVREAVFGPLRLDLPVAGSVVWPSLALTAAAAVAAFGFRVGVIPLLAGCAAAGVVLGLLGLAG
jgi:chromate transporter